MNRLAVAADFFLARWMSRAVSKTRPLVPVLVLMLLASGSAFAQADPWSHTADALLRIFTGPLARAFVVVAIVISGLTLAFSESGGKRGLAGLIFGGALAIGASQMAAVLFQ